MCLVTGCPDNSIRSQRRIRRLCFKHDLQPPQDAAQQPYGDGKKPQCDETCPSISLGRVTSDFDDFGTPASPPCFVPLPETPAPEEEEFTPVKRTPPVKNNSKPAKKTSKESSEKRKEKSREAARCRRSKESELYSALSDCLPLPRDLLENLDKASIMRLAIACLHTGDMIDTSLALSSHAANSDTSSLPWDAGLQEVCEGQFQESLLQAVDGFVLGLSCVGDVAYVSSSIARYLGLAQVDVMGVSLYDIVHQCDHEDLRQLLAIPTPSKDEARLAPLDGRDPKDEHLWEPRHGFLRMKCTLASKGRNVTIRNASYKVVEVSGKLVYRLARRSDVSPLGWLMCVAAPVPHPANIEVPLDRTTFFSKHTLDMKFQYADENFPQFCGFSPCQLEGQSLFQLHHEMDGPLLRQAFNTLRSKGQVNTGSYRFLVLGGGYVWLVTQATVIHAQRDAATPAAIVCLHYVISGVEEAGVVLSCVQLLPRLTSASPRHSLPLEGAGADCAGAAAGVLAMTVTALPNSHNSASASHSTGKRSLKLLASRSPPISNHASPNLIPTSSPTPYGPSIECSYDPLFVDDAAAVLPETSYLTASAAIVSDQAAFGGPLTSQTASKSPANSDQHTTDLALFTQDFQESTAVDDTFFGISTADEVTEPDSVRFGPDNFQSEPITATNDLKQQSPVFSKSIEDSIPLFDQQQSSPLLSQSAAGVWNVKSSLAASVKDTPTKKACTEELLSPEPLTLEQYLFLDSSCDSGSLDLFEDIQQQSSSPSLDESMDFINHSPFLKTEDFLDDDDMDNGAPLLHLSEDESLIMWSPAAEEACCSNSSSNDGSVSSSHGKRSIESCDNVFSPDSGFEGGLFTSAGDRCSSMHEDHSSHRDSVRRSSFSELLHLSISSPQRGQDAPASCIDPNTVWPGLVRHQPPQEDKLLDFEQLLHEDDDEDEEEPTSSPSFASVLARGGPRDGTFRNACPSSSSGQTPPASARFLPARKTDQEEPKYRASIGAPTSATAVSTSLLVMPTSEKPPNEPPVPTIKRPPSPFNASVQLVTCKRMCSAPSADEGNAGNVILKKPVKSGRPLVKPNMPCVQQLLVSNEGPDKNSRDGLKKSFNSVLRNLLVSGRDFSKEHYVLPPSSPPTRAWSPPSSSSSSKCSSADSDSADDTRDNSSPNSPVRASPCILHRPLPSPRLPKSSIANESPTVSSSAQECADFKQEDGGSSLSSSASSTLLLRSTSLGRMKFLRLASPPAIGSLYATRSPDGRLQLCTQRAPAKMTQSVLLGSPVCRQTFKSSTTPETKPTAAIMTPCTVHYCGAAPDSTQVLKLKGCGCKKLLVKRHAKDTTGSGSEKPSKRQFLVARDTASRSGPWLTVSPNGCWTTASGIRHNATSRSGLKEPEIYASRSGQIQSRHSECLYMEDSSGPSVTIVPFL